MRRYFQNPAPLRGGTTLRTGFRIDRKVDCVTANVYGRPMVCMRLRVYTKKSVHLNLYSIKIDLPSLSLKSYCWDIFNQLSNSIQLSSSLSIVSIVYFAVFKDFGTPWPLLCNSSTFISPAFHTAQLVCHDDHSLIVSLHV